jgi:hypothetical protein
MKKLLVITTALCAFAGANTAQAEISVVLGQPAPAYYAEPAYVPQGYVARPDWPSEHYDIHRHRHNDYWARHNINERERYEREHHR